MIDYILCLLGIFIYFLTRYTNRKKKNSTLSIPYWWKDNWPEFVTTLSLNAALMIIIHFPETKVSFDRFFESLPFDLHVAGIPTLSFFLGLGLTATFYKLFKTKVNI